MKGMLQVLVSMALLLGSVPTSGSTLPTPKKQVIEVRLIAREYLTPPTTFGRIVDSYIAELVSKNGQNSIVRLSYQVMLFEARPPKSFFDYSAVHKFRALADRDCDTTLESASYTYSFSASGDFLGRKPSLEYFLNAPRLGVSPDTRISCYVVTPKDYRSTKVDSRAKEDANDNK